MTVHSAPGDKRERILAAAERVFAKNGFFAARVSEIAKDAGVADGTIYLYFKSKDDLLISLFENRMKQVIAMLERVTAGKAPVDALRSFIRAYLQLIHDEPEAAEVLTIELRQSSKFMKEYANPQFADFLRMLGGIVARGQDDGSLADAVPSHIAARMIFGVLDELALAWVLAKQPISGSVVSAGQESGADRLKKGASGARPKKFDIVRAADWVGGLVTQGLERRSNA